MSERESVLFSSVSHKEQRTRRWEGDFLSSFDLHSTQLKHHLIGCIPPELAKMKRGTLTAPFGDDADILCNRIKQDVHILTFMFLN